MRGDSRAIKPFVDIFSQLKYSQCEIRPQTFAALSNLSDKRVVSLLSEYLVAHCFKAESGTSVERHALSGRTWNQNLHMFTRGKTTGLGVDARLALVKLGSTYASFSGTTICLHANRMEVDGDGYCRDCDEILYRRYREPIRAKGAIGHDEMNVNTMSKSQWHQRMEAVFGAKHVIEQASLRG